MTTHPVRFRVEPAVQSERVHVAIRLALLVVLGALGWSSLYWLSFLALPVVAALLVSSNGAERYLTEDAAPLVRALRWLAAGYAYLWLLTDTFPPKDGDGPVDLQIDPQGTPTTGSALLRLLYSVPAVFLLALFSFVASILWVVGAVAILVRRRVPRGIAEFIALTLAYQFRLAAYHLSLVDRYPSFQEAPLADISRSHTA